MDTEDNNENYCEGCEGCEDCEECNECGCMVNCIKDNIFIVTKGEEDRCWCQSCFDDLWKDAAADGWGGDDIENRSKESEKKRKEKKRKEKKRKS